MSDMETRIAGSSLLDLPLVAHAVAVVYNLPSLGSARLRLSGSILADIYLGKITRWNDPRIVKLNPGLALPDLTINPVHQSYNSGTTFVFTAYLCAVSHAWYTSVGTGRQAHWPVGLSGYRAAGTARMVSSAPGSLGYLELSDAGIAALPAAAIQNAQGNFVVPTVDSAEAAALAATLTCDLRGSIVNSPAPFGYPLVGYYYVSCYKHLAGLEASGLIVWMLTDPHQDAAVLSYIPLPPSVRAKALTLVTHP